jgi:hypothetical protein
LTSPKIAFLLATCLPCVHTCLYAQESPDELRLLRNKITEQERQLEDMRKRLREQGELLDRLIAAKTAPQTEAAKPVQAPDASPPLTIQLGRVRLKPGGFLDLSFVARSKNLGSGVPTAFGNIPFGDTVQGNLSDVRFSAQNSRISMGAETEFAGLALKAYVESDFLGQAPANIAVTNNGGTLRMRQYWASVQRNNWEILGGQAWSLITPNRKGLGSDRASVFTTLNEDPNYMAGLVWGRDPQVRLILKPTPSVTAGFSLEAAEQYSAGVVTLPAALAGIYSTQINNGAGNLSAPTVMPDMIAKVAYDRGAAHLETAGFVRAFRVYDPLNAQHHTTAGYGASVNGNVEMFRGFRFLANTYISRGSGRYMFGLGPDVVAAPDGSLDQVDAYAALGGFEWTRPIRGNSYGASTALYGYYGADYFARNALTDANGSAIGFGHTGAPSGANRSIQQASFGVNVTMWNSPLYGTVRLMTQFSYLTRSPWWMPPGRPHNAPLNMMYVGLRYDLP